MLLNKVFLGITVNINVQYTIGIDGCIPTCAACGTFTGARLTSTLCTNNDIFHQFDKTNQSH